MAYATVDDVQSRMSRELSGDSEEALCATLLDDAAVMIDAIKASAPDDVKLIVSCRMVIRALGDGNSNGIPLGASQGSMSGLGYSQSWTMGSGGGTGELYIGKTEKSMLKCGNAVGSYSPVQDLVEDAS